MMRPILLTAAALLCLSTVSEARPRAAFTCVSGPCYGAEPSAQPVPTASNPRVSRRGTSTVSVVGSRPAGCPARYCGCASALYVGLRAKWNVNLAANWPRHLPRAAPGPMMAAARPGHVKIIIGSAGNGLWRFYDPNSGGGRTRITVGSLAGYTVVDPRG